VQQNPLMNEPQASLSRDLCSFYAALAELEVLLGGPLHLETCKRKNIIASRGVYFFFEDAEVRAGSGTGGRVVRVGTHGLGAGSASTLWSRLRQHRGASGGGGNQRGSIFRRHVGAALMDAGLVEAVPDWWVGSKAAPAQRMAERRAEVAVSCVIRRMPLLFLPLDDAAGPGSDRGFIERNTIALLSSRTTRALDPPSSAWLGRYARAPEIRASGLWNVRHVGDAVDPAFLDRLWRRIREST